jgi:DNA-binding transcriptional ArsR family regulator
VNDDPDLRRLLWYLLGATRGGRMRAKLIGEIREQPGNMNQLAQRLGVDYRLVDHHMNVLTKNSIVTSTGERYGKMYSLSPWMEAHVEIFDQLCVKLKFDDAKPKG